MSELQIWILGATGRIGRALTSRLHGRGFIPTLVGRDRGRLDALGAERTLVTTDVTSDITARRPDVVVNLTGDYARTASTIARAGMPGGHYVDLANDVVSLPRLLALHDEAVDAGSTLITASGFGALATEAVVARLCEGRPVPSHVRVDSIGSFAPEDGVLGEAFAATTVDVLATGGRRYRDGRLVGTRLGSDLHHLTTPDGQHVDTAHAPGGELVVARRTSGAPNVTVTTALVPTSLVVRLMLPVARALLSAPPVRRTALTRLTRMRTKAAPRPREHSWGHAVVEWPDGTHREGWLRVGDAMDYTADVLTEVVARLTAGENKPGAWTPATAFGPDLAVSAGGTFILE